MSLNILRLNDDCIECVLTYLPIENHISFSQVCHRFRDVWLRSQCSLYTRFEVGNTDKTGNLKQEILLLRQVGGNVKHLILNVNIHCQWHGIFLDEICKIMQTMSTLKHAILWLRQTEPYNNVKIIVCSLKDLPNIRGIAIYQDNCVVDSLCQFNNYKDLLEDVKMSRYPLTDMTHFQSKIQLLVFHNASIRTILSELVRHLIYIRELSFGMVEDATQYTPLAMLPKLTVLQVFGDDTHNYGPLLPLLSEVSSKLAPRLMTLTINGLALGYAETAEIVRLQSLKCLDCHLTDNRCLTLLTSLQFLKYLIIKLPTSPSHIDSLVLDLLQNCRDLNVLQINSPNLSSSFLTQAYEVLEKVRDLERQAPLTLLFDNTPLSLAEHMSRYLNVFWFHES